MLKKDFPGNSRALSDTWFLIPSRKQSLEPMVAETQQLLTADSSYSSFFSARHLELVLTLFIFIIKQGFPSGYPKVGSVMPEQFWSMSEVNLQDSFVLFGPSKVSWMKYVLLVQLMFRCWAAGVYARCVKEKKKKKAFHMQIIHPNIRLEILLWETVLQVKLGLDGTRNV